MGIRVQRFGHQRQLWSCRLPPRLSGVPWVRPQFLGGDSQTPLVSALHQSGSWPVYPDLSLCPALQNCCRAVPSCLEASFELGKPGSCVS